MKKCIKNILSMLKKKGFYKTKECKKITSCVFKTIFSIQRKSFNIKNNPSKKAWGSICEIEDASYDYYRTTLDGLTNKLLFQELMKGSKTKIHDSELGKGVLENIERTVHEMDLNIDDVLMEGLDSGCKDNIKKERRKVYEKLINIVRSTKEDRWNDQRIDELFLGV
eukprot:GHVP01061782.1.p1 GENE.GHVP01061782.1~~GHVP01061782.1.p1  ORF type:complete len:167 (+),score=34.93 GHVP01061782.1:204-704(+)